MRFFLFALVVAALSFLFPFVACAQVRADRLELLARRIQSVPQHRINLATWSTSLDIDDPSSVACFAAWGTTIAEFQADGFRLIRGPAGITVEFEGLQDYRACSRFFGITHAQAIYLFSQQSPDSHRIPVLTASLRRIAADARPDRYLVMALLAAQ